MILPNVVELAEWQTVILDGVCLNAADQELASRLSEGADGKILIDQLLKGVRIRATSWVGVVRFSKIEIHVLPKVAGDNLGLLRLLDYASGLDVLRRHGQQFKLDVAGDNLLDLIALLLLEACDWVVRQGVLHDYVGRQDEITTVRGRIMLRLQAVGQLRRPGRVACLFDERESDIPENRLLSTAVASCRRWVKDERLKWQLSRLFTILAEVAPPGHPKEDAQLEIEYHRLNEHYREAHELARLVLRGLGVDDLFSTGTTSSFAFLLDMNALFERFVWRLCGDLLRGRPYQVDYQHAERSAIVDIASGRPYTRVVPDLLVSHRGDRSQRLPIDAKYKLYGERRVANEDVYQTFLYAFAHQGNGDAPRRAMIVYPATKAVGPLELEIRGPQTVGARISVIGCRIPEVLAEVTSGTSGPASRLLSEAIDRAMSC